MLAAACCQPSPGYLASPSPHRDEWCREGNQPTIGNGSQQLAGDNPLHALRDVWKLWYPFHTPCSDYTSRRSPAGRLA